jgi:3-methyladenine DNA glycosylase AlkD
LSAAAAGRPVRTAAQVRARLRDLADPEAARFAQRFFRTGPGEYGEGDVFIGIRVPVLRVVAREHRTLPLAEVRRLLRSRVHEDRFVALAILVEQYRRGDARQRERIHRLYLHHTDRVNNWDLVDVSAHKLVGAHLADRGDRALLDRLARSDALWERRIAMIATLHFIRDGESRDALRIARTLLHDEHDLIHKAVGWMLREVGKRDQRVEEEFLSRHHREMPRTMLRYAIERLSPALRQKYMAR